MNLKILKALVLSVLLFLVVQSSKAQEYYWVGGTGVWADFGIHWATTSGGSTFHTSQPTINDNVHFDANSFTGPNNIVTVGDPTIFCHDMTWIGIPNGTTFVCGANINISGSLIYASNMSLLNNSGVTTFISGNSEIINSGGFLNPLKNVTFNGNGTWALQNYLNVDNDITLDKGTLITNSNNLMCSKFISTPAILTNLRILDLGNSTWYIKSANNPPYLSWNVDNSMFTFHSINPGNSLIHFLAVSGLSTMHAGIEVTYNNTEFDGNGRMEVDLDTIHNATFHGNGEIIGDSNIFNNVQCDKYGMINGHNNVFHDVNIDGPGDIGNLSLIGRDVNHNRFHDVSIGNLGYVYGDYNMFHNLLFSTSPAWPCEPGVCCYAGATDPGFLYGNYDTVYNNLVFNREGHIFGGYNYFYDATFWCDAWVLQGSNEFFNINLYRDYQECFSSFQNIVPLSVHSNVLTLQSDSTQYLFNDFNLLGNYYCKHTEIRSSSSSVAANLNSDSVLVLDYVKLSYIHSANTPNISDTAIRSEDNGGNFFWDFNSPYGNVGQGIPNVTPTSPCYNDCNGQVNLNPVGGVPPYAYSTQIWMPGFDGIWTGLQASSLFTGLCGQNYPFLVVDHYGCLLPFNVPVPFPPMIDTTMVIVTPIQCFGETNGTITIIAFGGTGTLTYSIDAGATYQSSDIFTNLAAGQYNIRVKDSVGCFRDFGPFIIIEPPLLTLNTGGQSFIIKCHGDSTGMIIAIPSGGTPPYTYDFEGPFSSEYTQITLNTSQDTIYGHGGYWYVTVTDAHGCVATDLTQREDPSPIVVGITVTSYNNCADTNSFVLHGTISGGNFPFIGYNWYDSANNWIGIGLTYQFVSLGTFMLVAENIYHCKDSAYKTIDILHDSITLLKNKSCKGSSTDDGAICVSGLHGSGSYSFLWNTESVNQCIAGLDTGTYFVTVTDAQYGCKVIDSIPVIQPDSILTIFLYADSTSCYGLQDGIARVVASGGTPPYSYQWTGNTGPGNNDSIIGQAAGVYFVKVTDSLGCDITGTITIFSPPPGQVAFDSGWYCTPQGYWAQAIVSGGTLPYAYNWSPSYGSISDIVIGPPGIYTVTVTDGNGCPYQGNVELFQFQVLLDRHDALCYHDNTGWAKVTASHGNPPFTYHWYRSGPPPVPLSSATDTQTGLNAGDYFVVVQDIVGCSDTTFFTITEPAAPVAISIQANSDNNLCFADCKGFAVATTQGGVWPYTYSWIGPNPYTNTSGIISNLCAGIYHVTVTDNNGCVMVGQDTITSMPEIIVDSIVIVSPSCNLPGYTGSATVYAHGGTGTFKYRLDGGLLVSSPFFNNLAPGGHNMQVSDFYGCFININFTVPVPPLLNVVINIIAVPLSFSGMEGELGTTVTGGTPGYSYIWTTGATTPGITGLGAGLYCVTVTDSHGCVTTNCKILSAPGPLVLTISYQDIVCHGDNNGNITASASGGVPPYIFAINPVFPGTGSNPFTYSNLSPGLYIINLTDNNGITQTDTVVLTEPLPYSLTLNYPDSVCPGTTEGWAEAIVTGNTQYNNPPYYNFSWSSGTIVTPSTVSGLSPGTYTVNITDSKACPISGSFTIYPYDKPLADFSLAASICLGNTITITNTSSVLHSTLVKAVINWGDGPDQTYFYPTGTIQHLYVNPGNYIVAMFVTDANQCVSLTVSHNIQILPIPEAIISYDTACFGNPTHLSDLSLNSNTPGIWEVDGLVVTYQSNIFPVMDHWGMVVVKLIVQNALNCRDSVSVLVPVDSLPNPNFSFHDSICAGGFVRFTDLSAANGSPIQQYQWSFGDGYGSVLKDPLHDFLQTNMTYPVTLTVTSARGCSDSLTKPVPVSLPFSLGLEADTVCLGYNTHFTGIALTPAGDNLVMQYWYFGDGNSSLVTDPNHQYANPGNYIAVLVGIDENGCQEIVFDSNVIVYPLPIAAFNYHVNCQNYIVDFTSTSQFITGSGNLLEWTWESGGVPQTTTNPAIQHTYPGPGTYLVRLVIFNGNNCTDTLYQQVNLDPPLVVDFSFDQACAGANVHFQDHTQISPTSWYWNFGTIPVTTDIVANPTHVFPAANVYNVTLTVYDVNHCPYSLTKAINILPLPNAAFSTLSTYNCQKDSVHFIDASTTAYGNIVSWNWNFGDIPSGNNNLSAVQDPSHFYNQANTYNVMLVVQSDAGNGCTDTVQNAMLVRPSPIAGFTFTNSCFGNSTVFTNTSIPVNANTLVYAWNFGEVSSGLNNFSSLKDPKHIYAAPGTYIVTLIITDEFSCPDSIKISVTVLPLPIAAFSHSTLCLGNPVLFTNLTNPVVGTTTEWHWNFGDPQSMADSISTLQHPTHTFVSAGTYFITLLVKTNNGCMSNITSVIVIPASPIANFTAQDTCLGKPTNFQDLSSSSNSPVNSWTWDFGDIQTANTQNPVHVYALSGTYNVILTVKDNAQCTGSVSLLVYIHALPIPDFYSTIYCTDNPVNFLDLSSGAGFPITSWSWNFGDPGNPPNTSILQNPEHTYLAQNFYSVTLQVQNSKGCVNSVTQPIFVSIGAVADFEISTTDTCTGSVIHFHDISYGIGSTVVSWYWDFGNSIISTAKNPSVTYYSSGIHQVSLTITTAIGCRKTILKDIMVNPLPNVIFNYPTPLCDGSPVNFSGIANSPGSTGVFTWLWNMGYNGDQSSLQNPLPYTYPASGTYSVELTVTDSHNCKNTYAVAVAIHLTPVADFTSILIHPPCDTRKVCFTDNTDWSTSQAASWLWSFGDLPTPGTAVLPDPCYTYLINGNYPVTLEVINSYGCVDQLTKIVPVFPPQGPVAGFSVVLPPAGVHCDGDTVKFIDATIIGGGSILNSVWNFGDTGSAALNVDSTTSPKHLFSHTGVFNVTVTVTDVNYCTSSFSLPVTINATPVPGFTSDVDCQGTLVTFNDTSIYNGTYNSRNWNIDGAGAGSLTPMHHLFTSTGNHTILLTVMNQAGCSASISKNLFVFPAPFAAFNIQPPVNACVNSSVNFDASASQANFGPGVTYNWDFGDGITSTTGPLITHTYLSGSTFTIKLIVTNSHGCKDTLSQALQVRALPNPSIAVTSTTCLHDTIHFQGSSTTPNGSIQTWNWYFDHGTPNNYATVQNPNHVFPVSPAGLFHVQLTVYDGYCTNLIIDTVTINPLPSAAFTSDIACIGSPTHFTDQSSSMNGPIIKWDWYHGNSWFSPLQNPAFTMPQQGLIPVKLMIKDSKSCKNQITNNIAVDSLPIPAFTWGDTCTLGINAGQVHFQDQSNPNSGTISTWLWQLTPTNTSSIPNPLFSFYPVNQTYPVILTITRRGCQASVTHNVFVKPAFSVDFTYQPSCLGSPSTFVPLVVQPPNTPHGNWTWKFGDNAIGSSVGNASHAYTQTGNYYVQITTTSNTGCTDSTGHMIEVFPLPQPIFAYDTTSCFELTHFTSLSLPGIGSITGLSWNFGDGSPVVTNPNPTHAYPPTGGTYWVKLTVTNSDNCSSTDSVLVIHLPCGNAGFTLSDTLPCTGMSITFTDTTTLGGTSVFVDRVWNFGNAAPVSHTNPVTVVFNVAGTYTVTLIVTFQANNVQFTDTATHQFTIYNTPIAKFQTDSACFGFPINFTNQSSIPAGTFSNQWDFGYQGGTSLLQNPPPLIYPWPGDYLATLIVVSDHNCPAAVSHIVHIWPIPVAAFSANPLSNCGIPDEVTFSDQSSGNIQYCVWNSGYGMDITVPAGDQVLTYNAYGVFSPSLTVISDKSCSNSVTHPGLIKVLRKPEPMFSYDPKPVSILAPTVQFNNQTDSPGNYNCEWNFGDNTAWHPGDCNPSYTYSDTGTYMVILYVRDENGCDSSATLPLLVFGEMTVYVPNAFTPDGDGLNDVFGPTGMYLNPDGYLMTIFTRWGEEIFNSDSPGRGWDGKVRGTDVVAPVDVYVYYIRVKDLKGSVQEFKGYVMLLKKE